MQPGDRGTAQAGKEDVTRMVGPAVRAEIDQLPEEVQQSAEAAASLSIALILDDGDVAASAKAALYKMLLETLDRLRALAPEQQEDSIDQLRARRDSRRSAA